MSKVISNKRIAAKLKRKVYKRVVGLAMSYSLEKVAQTKSQGSEIS